MASVILILGAITIAFLTHKLFPLILLSKQQQPRGTKQPPGPPGIPLLGNLLQIQPIHSWLQFKEWADKYGPIYRFSIAGRENIVVSTEKIANDLLRERGTLYSGREHLVMAGDLLSDNLRPLLLSYTDLWRRGRKLMHAVTMTSMADSYQPIQSHESKRLLYDLLQDPKRYEFWFERYSSAVIFRIGYGMKVETGEEAFIKRALNVVHTVERVASPGSYLVDTFPILRYSPEILAPFKKEGRLLHAEELDLFRGLLLQVREQLKLGSAPPSMMKTFLEQQEKFDLSDDEGAYVIGTLFEAGSGTTAAAMMSYVFAMTHYPEWQREMWKELDEVVGKRMPEFDDIPQLPVCRAVIKEVLRWRPVTAGGVPHQLVKDDVYNGFFFPAGTNVHANQWAIHREEALYPDPETFNPARWLRPEYPTYKESLTKFPTLQNYSSFGFGRRICPGMNIAERSLYILTARLAWSCEISKRKDKEGKEIEVPWYDYTSGFNVQPKPFEFVLRPRSRDIERVVGEAWESVREHDSLV